MPTFLLGYSAEYDVFVFWEALLREDSGYSANLQVPGTLIADADAHGWAVGDARRVQAGEEVRVAVAPEHLALGLHLTKRADDLGLSGGERSAWLRDEFETAEARSSDGESASGEAEGFERARIVCSRWRRSSQFRIEVLSEYDHRCAVCGVSLGIVEAAHIIPVSNEGSHDERWNGLSLCRNHHGLYDRSILWVDEELVVHANDEVVDLLIDLERAHGVTELIHPYIGSRLPIRPAFWHTHTDERRKMQDALGQSSVRFRS
jgi:putative restriction endonuclease